MVTLRANLYRRILASSFSPHFDAHKSNPYQYDCFYASVFEHENPTLKFLPLAVQQKGIVATCNYEARRQGLSKLMLISEAKKKCPDVVIILGEDLTRFRDVSKELYGFLQGFIWSKKVERLGFDEVFMDVTDMISYNVSLLNLYNLENAFFHLSKDDPTVGFSYDASKAVGHTFPPQPTHPPSPPKSTPPSPTPKETDPLYLRLLVASHLAKHLRQLLEHEKGYTCTSGISTSKLLSKLAGAANKPNAQTTLLPPYSPTASTPETNITYFMDTHEIGRIPGIGFKLAHKIRTHVLAHPVTLDTYTGPKEKEKVLVKDVLSFPGMSPSTLDNLLAGPGSPQGIGAKVWGLLNGVDDTPVAPFRTAPRQISIEDSYRRLDSLEDVTRELGLLARSLVRRMHVDLLEDDPPDPDTTAAAAPSGRKQHWIAHPRTLRLSTRPRGGPRDSTRVSKSMTCPGFIFSLDTSVDAVADRLATESLIPLFRKLHPERRGWDLSVVNIAVTNMFEGAGEGGDIGRMFRRQGEGGTGGEWWRVEDRDVPPSPPPVGSGGEEEGGGLNIESEDSGGQLDGYIRQDHHDQEAMAEAAAVKRIGCDFRQGSEDQIPLSQDSGDGDTDWEMEDYADTDIRQNGDIGIGMFHCEICDARMPDFAMLAHERLHDLDDDDDRV